MRDDFAAVKEGLVHHIFSQPSNTVIHAVVDEEDEKNDDDNNDEDDDEYYHCKELVVDTHVRWTDPGSLNMG